MIPASPARGPCRPRRARRGRTALFALAAVPALAAFPGCDRPATPRVAAPPGSPLEAVAGHAQPRAPVDAFAVHLDGVQFPDDGR